MQKLVKKNTYTPTNISARGCSQVPSKSHWLNCDQPFKNLKERVGVAHLKTFSNNPDATLTTTRQAEQNTIVSIIYPVLLGINSGYSYIGASAIAETREVYTSEFQLRTDMVKLKAERKQYRRARRSRKTWYRKDGFLKRGNKKKGWLAPSIQHKLTSHIKNTASRFISDFQKFDKVLFNGIECFIFGKRKTSYFDLRKLNNLKIHASAKAADCILLETVKTFLTERRGGIFSNSARSWLPCCHFS